MYCFVSEMTSTRTRESQTLNKTVTIIMESPIPNAQWRVRVSAKVKNNNDDL